MNSTLIRSILATAILGALSQGAMSQVVTDPTPSASGSSPCANPVVTPGTGPTTGTTGSTAVGCNTQAINLYSTAVGDSSLASDGSTAIGAGATATTDSSQNFGALVGSVAVGHGANASGEAVAIGAGAVAAGTGNGAGSYSTGGVAIGFNAFAGENATSIGNAASADSGSVAINGIATNRSIVIGQGNASNALSDDNSASVGAVRSTGSSASVGMDSQAQNQSSSLGREATSINNSVAVGYHAHAVNATNGDGGISVGSGASTTGGVAIGTNAFATQGVVIGNSITQYNPGVADGVLIGRAITGGMWSVVLGDTSFATDQSVAIGHQTYALTANSVAIGANSRTNAADQVSFGDAGSTRRLSWVSDGVQPYDAVNLRQLQAVGGYVATTGLLDGTDYASVTNTLGPKGSFAIGPNSYSGEDGEASVGNVTTGLTRRVTNVANARDGSDAMTLNQGQSLAGALGGPAGFTNGVWNGAQFQAYSTQTKFAGAASTVYDAFGVINNSLADLDSRTAAGNPYFVATPSAAGGPDAPVVFGNGSVAIGAGSVALGDNVVSVGNPGILERRIAGVANGQQPDDVMTVGQGQQLANFIGGGSVFIAGNLLTSPFSIYSATTHLASGQATIADSLGSLSDSVFNLDNRVNNLETNPGGGTGGGLDANAVHYDDVSHATASLNGPAGTVLSGVANGSLQFGSSEAVNGGQVAIMESFNAGILGGSAYFDPTFGLTLGASFNAYNATSKGVDAYGDISSTFDAINQSLGNIDNRLTNVENNPGNPGGPTGPVSSTDGQAVHYDDASHATATLDGANGTKIQNVADGVVQVGSKDAVNGGQLAAVQAESHQYTDTQVNQAIDTAKSYTDKSVATGVQDAKDWSKNYTDSRIRGLNDRINESGAAATAMVQQVATFGGMDGTNKVAAGVGYQGGSSAISVGYQHVSESRKVSWNVGGAVSGQTRSIGAGAGYSW